MNTIGSTTATSMFVLCALPIFVILFAAILASLQRSAMFGKNTTIAVALCATLLCMFGLYETFVRPGNANETDASREGAGFDFLLIPYVALALAILTMFLLLFIRKVLGHDDGRKPHPDTFSRNKTSYASKNPAMKSRSPQDLGRLRRSRGPVRLGPGNESDNPGKRQGNSSQIKEMLK